MGANEYAVHDIMKKFEISAAPIDKLRVLYQRGC